jgi:RNA polymerase sigma factor (sigma-70 family)
VSVLSRLLRGNPCYEEHLAEQVLQEYLRIHRHTIDQLCARGWDYDDVVQELRIKLWYHWQRFQPGKVRLQQWLSWRMRHTLKNLQQRTRTLPCVPIEWIESCER